MRQILLICSSTLAFGALGDEQVGELCSDTLRDLTFEKIHPEKQLVMINLNY